MFWCNTQKRTEQPVILKEFVPTRVEKLAMKVIKSTPVRVADGYFKYKNWMLYCIGNQGSNWYLMYRPDHAFYLEDYGVLVVGVLSEECVAHLFSLKEVVDKQKLIEELFIEHGIE